MRFNCTSCGQRYKADKSFAGEEIECSKCNTLIFIPNIEPVPVAVVVPQIKISIPGTRKTSVEPSGMDKVEVPKLTLPASLGKNLQANKTEKTPSHSMSASIGEKLGASSREPSFSTSASTSEKLGASSREPSFSMSASTSERLGESSRVPSLAMSASTGEKLRG